MARRVCCWLPVVESKRRLLRLCDFCLTAEGNAIVACVPWNWLCLGGAAGELDGEEAGERSERCTSGCGDWRLPDGERLDVIQGGQLGRRIPGVSSYVRVGRNSVAIAIMIVCRLFYFLY